MPDKGAMHHMVRCSTLNRMIEEDSTEEIEVNSAEGDRVSRPEDTTLTNGKMIRAMPDSSVEGGAILSDRAIVTTRSNAGIVENSVTMKRSAEKRYETRLRLADNSRTTLRIPTTTIVAGCS